MRQQASPSERWGPKASQSGSLRFSLGSGAVGEGVVGWAGHAHPSPLPGSAFPLFLPSSSTRSPSLDLGEHSFLGELVSLSSTLSTCTPSGLQPLYVIFYPLPYMDHWLNLCCNPAPWAVVPAPGKFPQEPGSGSGPDQAAGQYPCPQARSHWAECSEMREG